MNLEPPNRLDRRPRTTALLASLTDDLREIRRTAKKRLSLITRRSSLDVIGRKPKHADGEDDDTIQLLDERSDRTQSKRRDCGVDDYYLEHLRRRSLRDSPLKKAKHNDRSIQSSKQESKRKLQSRRSSCSAAIKSKVAIFNISYDYLADDITKSPQARDPNASLTSLTLEESYSTFQNDSLSTFRNESYSSFRNESYSSFRNDSYSSLNDSLRVNDDSFRMHDDCFDWASTGGLSQDRTDVDHNKECFFVVSNDSWIADKEGIFQAGAQSADGSQNSNVDVDTQLAVADTERIKDKDGFNEEDAEEWQTKFQQLGEEYQKLWEHCQGLVSEINKKNQLLKNQDDRTLTRKEMKRQLYWYALENVLLRKRLAIQEQEQKLLRTRLQRHKDADAEKTKSNI